MFRRKSFYLFLKKTLIAFTDTKSHDTMNTSHKSQTIISIHVGQAGVQIGAAMWDLLLREHGLSASGFKSAETCPDRNAQVMFHQWSGPKYTAKSCFIDCDINTLNRVRKSAARDVFQSDYVLYSRSDSGGIYSRGYTIVAEEILEKVLRWVNRMAEGSDYPCGFLFTHSLGGGTGSGVTSRLVNILKSEYPKSAQVQLSVIPTQKVNNNTSLIVEPYNVSLHIKDTLEDNRAVILVDNEALFRILYGFSGLKTLDYFNINSLVAHVLSALTSGTRFNGPNSVAFPEIETNTMASRRMRFATTSFSPVTSPQSSRHNMSDVNEILNTLFEPKMYHLTSDFYSSKIITTTVLYRGVDSIGEVNARLRQLVGKKALRFADWVPPSIKLGCVDSTSFLPFGELFPTQRSATLISNSTAVYDPLNAIHRCVSSMSKKKAFHHWYTNSGMYEEELTASEEYLSEIIDEYNINTWY